MTINGTDLLALGLTGKSIGLALNAARALPGTPGIYSDADILDALRGVIARPGQFEGDEPFGALAHELNAAARLRAAQARDALNADIHPYQEFGGHLIEQGARDQMNVAMRLPITVSGALMPDAHPGYTVPIGGVLETRGAVIPAAVGVDIGCSMMLTLTDVPAAEFGRLRDAFTRALLTGTSFGLGCQGFGEDAEVLGDEAAWSALPAPLRGLRDQARAQFGSQGGGNHFAGATRSVEIVSNR